MPVLYENTSVFRWEQKSIGDFANHYLIARGMGVLVIPEKEVLKFKKLLVAFYEGENTAVIYGFMKERCWKNF